MGLLAVLLVYLWAVGTAPGRWLDQRVYSAVLDGLPSPVRLGLADLSRPVLLVVLAGILAVLGAARSRSWVVA